MSPNGILPEGEMISKTQKLSVLHMSYRLNSLKAGYIEDYIGLL